MPIPINSYMTNSITAAGVTTSTLAPNVFRCAPFYVGKTVTINQLLANVTTQGTSGSRSWIAIYTNITGAGGEDIPGALVATTSEMLSDAATVKTIDITPVVLTAGLYWSAYNCNEVGTEPTYRFHPVAALAALGIGSGLGTNVQMACLSVARTYSAVVPTTAPTGLALTANAGMPILAMRRSA
jgi:hypothetical protein